MNAVSEPSIYNIYQNIASNIRFWISWLILEKVYVLNDNLKQYYAYLAYNKCMYWLVPDLNTPTHILAIWQYYILTYDGITLSQLHRFPNTTQINELPLEYFIFIHSILFKHKLHCLTAMSCDLNHLTISRINNTLRVYYWFFSTSAIVIFHSKSFDSFTNSK